MKLCFYCNENRKKTKFYISQMYKGRDRYKELIEELESTQAPEQEDQDDEKTHMINLRQLQNEQSIQEDRLCEILNSLEGKTVCGTLDFLSKVSYINLL